MRTRIVKAGAAWLMAAAVAAGPAAAQDLPFGDGGDIAVVDDLVVRSGGGPAWWWVSDADTTVFVLASPGPVPREVDWSRRGLNAKVSEANVVILPPTIAFGPGALLSIPLLIYRVSKLDNEGERMERKLPVPLRARFIAAREKLGRPEDRYGAHPPGMAALLLAGDAYDQAFPSQPRGPRTPRGPRVENVVRDVARKKNVRVERAGTYGVGIANDILKDMTRPGLDCVEAVLDELDKPLVQDVVQVSDGGAAVRAWAQGDVRPLLDRAAQPRPQGRGGLGTFALQNAKDRYAFRITNPVCAAPMTSSKALVEGFVTDQVNAITRALEKPGHAVAVVSATDLLRKGGVLEQLRARGFAITLPNADKEPEGGGDEEDAPASDEGHD